jgi:replicative DNA helicase
MADGSLFPARLPPVNLEAEQAILGALLARNRVIDQCDGLEPEHFFDAIHARIFSDCRLIIQAAGRVDPVLLKTRYENSGILSEVGGDAFLGRLLSAMVMTQDVRHYANAVRECWLRRQAIDLAEQLSEQAYGSDPDLSPTTIMERVSGALAGLAATGQPMRLVTLDDAMDAAEAATERAMAGHTSGISTGFRCFDARFGGLEPGLVYVIGGRPGMGKSGIGHQIALNVARSGGRVLEIALEMSATQLGRRTISTISGVPIFSQKIGWITNDDASRIRLARKEIAALPLMIDDTAGRTPGEIVKQVRAIKRTKGLDFVMIDHLNLMRADTDDARHGGTWATERASAAMMELAKECNVPVLLLAQLNRGVEGREDKRPALSDLRQAGAIEQDASAVGFVYRPEYYLGGEPERKEGETDDKFSNRRDDWHRRKSDCAGKAEVIWGKVRDGEPGTDPLLFDGPTATFREPS